jgi:hypothetical protein
MNPVLPLVPCGEHAAPVNLGSGGELSLYAVARGGCIGNVGQGDMGPIIP